MKLFKISFLLIACFAVSACNPANIANWMESSQLWKQQGPESYSYEMRIITKAKDDANTESDTVVTDEPSLFPAVFAITVTDGKVSSASASTTFPLTLTIALEGEILKTLPTIDMHYNLILPMLLDPSLTAEYDSNNGHPTSYSLGGAIPLPLPSLGIELIDDLLDELSIQGVQISNFSVL